MNPPKHGYRLRELAGVYWVIHIRIRTIKKVSEPTSTEAGERSRLQMSTEAAIYSQQRLVIFRADRRSR